MAFKKGKSGNPNGRPKGAKGKATLDKEAAREVLRDMVKAHLGPMVEAQVKHAKGISYLVYREKRGGKFTTVDAKDAEAIFARADKPADEGGVIIEVWEKEPSVQAFTDLMNRTIDKPAETVDTNVAGTLEIRWLPE